MRPVEMASNAAAMFASNDSAIFVSIAIISASPSTISPIFRSARAVPIITRLLALSCPAV